MLKHIRRATKEEVEAIRKDADYTERFTVFAMDQNEGEPDLAVVKEVVFLDPVKFGKHTNDVQKARFIWGLEEQMMGAGIQVYHTLVSAADERWRKVLQTWGCQEASKEPEILFRKELK